MIRFIGVTTHGTVAPVVLLKSLVQFDFDTVLLPYNYPVMQLPAYAETLKELLRECEARDVAVQTIESIARRPKQETSDEWTTWYEPLMDQRDIDKAVHWVLGRENVFLNSVADVNLLPMVLDAAARHRSGDRPSDGEMEAMVALREMARIFPLEKNAE